MRPPLPPGPWLVVGLARSGLAAGALLRERGDDVVGVDAGAPQVQADFPTHLQTDGVALLDGVQAVVKSPGVPPRAPVVAAARERGLPVLGELELAWRLLPGHPFVAVTGTNGKTTVTEWIAHVHRVAGIPVAAAGNVGTALSSLPGTIDAGTTVVCECSSYQLHDTTDFRPDVGVLLNIESDHLDWHGDEAAYRAAKLGGMFGRQRPEDVAVVPAAIPVPGVARRHVWDDEPVGEVGPAGIHNVANARAVAAACRERGVPEDALAEGLRSFRGVAHRLEDVAEIGGVRYVNDSKATNVAAALVALQAFDAPVHWIAGGDDAKREDFAPLAGRAATAHLIGEAAPRLHAALGAGEVCGDLEHALASAASAARPGDVVLLAPACASFDQFASFEERGARFKELVEARRTKA